MKGHYDIVIVGAGMVGLVCAHLLKDSGLSLAMVEAHNITAEWPRDGYDLRVSALNKNSQQLLDQIGCWQAIQAMRVGPYDRMQVFGQSSDYELNFSAAELAQDYLGYIVENSVIRQALLDQLPANIDIIAPVKLQSFADQQLILADGTALRAKLFIGADGGNSWLRNAANISVKTYSYEQQAIVATLKTAQSHQQTAYQCFLPTGPVALLPFDNAYYSSLVWSADNDYAQQLLAMPAAEFASELTKVFREQLGEIKLISTLQAFPLQMRHANDYVQPGIALIGDAVRTIHPLAGQGANLGLQDAASLAEIILNAVNKQRDFASLPTLQKYQRARKSQTIAMIVAMEFFKQAFANQTEKFISLRNSALKQIEHREFLKNFFADIASGREI